MTPPTCAPQRQKPQKTDNPHRFWRGVCLCAASALLLSACSGGGHGFSSSSGSSGNSSGAMGPAIAPLPALPAGGTGAGGASAASASSSDGVTSIAPIPTPMETFRALMPEQGLNTTPLFNKPVSNDEQRFQRLETSVQNLRNDFDTIMPTMVRMASMENDIQTLVNKLKVMSGEPTTADSATNSTEAQPSQDAAAPKTTSVPPKTSGLTNTNQPVSNTKTPEKEASKTANIDWGAIDSLDLLHENSKTPSPSGTGATVRDIRIGDHGTACRWG